MHYEGSGDGYTINGRVKIPQVHLPSLVVDKQLNGSIPKSFSDLPSRQTLSLQNNFLIGPVPTNIWQNVSFNASSSLMLNKSFSRIEGNLNPHVNVILRNLT
ncbi:hypothetical protein V6N11_065063 [Hibiscus sabdariffa]|uniref:Uncharacterized protein n=1 Tax=Hibiscus sabdariffa TaxID=183260 RepID=A0ABR2SIU4_9ROSI